jgi:hypothetical protein
VPGLAAKLAMLFAIYDDGGEDILAHQPDGPPWLAMVVEDANRLAA